MELTVAACCICITRAAILFIFHISHEIRTEIINYVVQSGAKFSILVDESTAVSNVQSMIVYMRMKFDDAICTYFLGLLEISDATSAGLESTLTSYLNDIGLSDDLMASQFVRFCSDGASCMIGEPR